MKIPIKYNPLGNGYDGAGGAVYGSTGCFLFRGSYCIQSGMQLDGKTIRNATRQPSRLEMFASGSTSDTMILGGTMYVNGGVATKTDVYSGGTMYVRSSGTASNVKIQFRAVASYMAQTCTITVRQSRPPTVGRS